MECQFLVLTIASTENTTHHSSRTDSGNGDGMEFGGLHASRTAIVHTASCWGWEVCEMVGAQVHKLPALSHQDLKPQHSHRPFGPSTFRCARMWVPSFQSQDCAATPPLHEYNDMFCMIVKCASAGLYWMPGSRLSNDLTPQAHNVFTLTDLQTQTISTQEPSWSKNASDIFFYWGCVLS